jgi:hypothetical protein
VPLAAIARRPSSRDLLEVIAGQTSELGHELGTSDIGELPDVRADPQARAARCLEDHARLADGEGVVVEVHVARVGEWAIEGANAMRCAGPRDHLAGHERDVPLAIVREFGWDRVRTEERRRRARQEAARELGLLAALLRLDVEARGLPRQAQETQLVLDREAVAGLHLDQRHAVRRERGEARCGTRTPFSSAMRSAVS